MTPFIDLSTIEPFNPFDGLSGKIIHFDNKTYAFWTIEAGTVVPEHHHENTQMAIVLKGKLLLDVDGKSQTLSKGQVALIPSNSPHSAEALTDVEILDVFNPIRADFPSNSTE